MRHISFSGLWRLRRLTSLLVVSTTLFTQHESVQIKAALLCYNLLINGSSEHSFLHFTDSVSVFMWIFVAQQILLDYIALSWLSIQTEPQSECLYSHSSVLAAISAVSPAKNRVCFTYTCSMPPVIFCCEWWAYVVLYCAVTLIYNIVSQLPAT